MKQLLFSIVILITLSAHSQTTVPGGSVHGTWTLAGSPYLVQGGLLIPNDSTLTIQAGVTVNFQGHYKLLVLGRLLALGSSADSIYFTAANASTGWYGIRFDNTTSNNDTSRALYCSIQLGKANGSGVDASGGAFMFNGFSKAVISHCLIKNNSGFGVFCTGGSKPLISNNMICYNQGGAINLSGSSNPDIGGNMISFNNGPGIIGSGNIISIHNNIISYNNGVGVKVDAGNILYNTISFNNSTFWGGGVYTGNDSSNPTIISHNTISNNTCSNDAYAGGIFCYVSHATVTYNMVTNNSCSSGAGIKILVGNPVISNNLIANNTASGSTGIGGGICCASNNVALTNNTIVNNSASNGGGIYFSGNTSPSINNCILYGNTASIDGAQVYLQDQTCQPNFYYCDIQGDLPAFGLNGNVYTGTYNNTINSNPFFISPSGGSGSGFNGLAADWSLSSISPCVNTGNPAGPYPSTDLAGNTRIYGTVIDMGAYELQSPSGISYNTISNPVHLYPNPANEQCIIETSTTEIQTIELFDSDGRRVFSKSLTGNAIINLAMLDEGIYTLTVKTADRVLNEKLIIIH
jgi:hypothetical protein